MPLAWENTAGHESERKVSAPPGSALRGRVGQRAPGRAERQLSRSRTHCGMRSAPSRSAMRWATARSTPPTPSKLPGSRS